MAFFKFRKVGDEHTNPPPAPESVEAMRKRAKHRLIGAAVLVLVGVVGFPMLFDNQPRPIPVDLPINIPDKNTVKPLGNLPVGNAAQAMIEETAEPAAASGQAPASAAVAKPGKSVAPVPTPAVTTPAVAPVAAAPAASRAASGALVNTAPVSKPPAKVVEKPVEKAIERPVVPKPDAPKPTPAKPEAAKADGSKAQSLLEGKETFIPATASSTPPAVAGAPAVARFVVQVGAFSDATKAREARLKLEAAGLKTYTQVVETKDGKRIRVRVGPFDTKVETDKVAAKVRKLDLPAAILEL
ncbi:MAG: sporulation protein [Burkholderiales bacterium PBB3]|nr:MAG: sporulation protein [Burkholderiales bacterium PBB3]